MHIFPFSRMPMLLAFAAMVATCLLLAASVSGSAQTRPALKVAEHPKLGPYLTTGGDTSVYLFEEDRPDGERGRPVESDCVDTCLERWPPVPGEPHPEAGEGADATLIGSFRRPDGKVQAMYNGWPLYTFADDYVPGDVNGHDFEEFGGEWYLMTPAGREVAGSLRDTD